MSNILARPDIGSPPLNRPPPVTVELTGRSVAVGRLHELLRRAASAEGTVLLVAERGTDVLAIAHDLHARSTPAGAPFVHVDCAATEPPDRDLFGSPTGIPTADLETIAGVSRLAAARGGTLFLHEITELPSGVQARLARTLRDGEVRLQGKRVATACRVIAGAAPAIDEEVHAQRFRADLFRRVSATRIDLPPLRDRADDVPALAVRILDDLSAVDGQPPRSFTQAALALLGAMTWPGNLAELRQAIARVAAATTDVVIPIERVLPALQLDRAPSAFVPTGNLRDARLRFERDYIAAVLQHHGWRMADAAQTLGIQRPNLYRKARQLGIPIVGTE